MNKTKIHHAWWIVVSCCALIVATNGLILQTPGIFMKPVSSELNIGIAELSLWITIFNITQFIFVKFAGNILNKFNIRIVTTIGMLGVTLGLVVMSFAKSVVYFYVAGLMIGVFGCFVMLITPAFLVSNWFKKKAGLALGIIFSCGSVAAAIVSPLITSFMNHSGWRLTYIVLAIIAALITLPFTLFVIRKEPGEMGLKPYGDEDEEGTHISTGNITNSEITGVSVGTAVKTMPFYMILIFTAVISMTIGFLGNLPVFGASLGYSSMVSATVLSAFLAGSVLGKIVIGILNDKFGPTKAITISAVYIVAGIVLLLNAEKGLAIFMIGAFALGACLGLVSLEPPILTRKAFGQKDYSKIYPYVSMVMSLGAAGSTPIFALTYDKTQSYTVALYLNMLYVIIALITAVIAMKSSERLENFFEGKKGLNL